MLGLSCTHTVSFSLHMVTLSTLGDSKETVLNWSALAAVGCFHVPPFFPNLKVTPLECWLTIGFCWIGILPISIVGIPFDNSDPILNQPWPRLTHCLKNYCPLDENPHWSSPTLTIYAMAQSQEVALSYHGPNPADHQSYNPKQRPCHQLCCPYCHPGVFWTSQKSSNALQATLSSGAAILF